MREICVSEFVLNSNPDMKTHSWPHPVLVSKLISENPLESDFKDSVDFIFEITKKSKNLFSAKVTIDSSVLRRCISSREIDLVLYLEALESPLRLTRRVDGSPFASGTSLEFPVDIDQSKFSGGLKLCAYLIAARKFELSTADCVDGYAKSVSVEKGALLGYSNGHMLFDDKSNISNIFKVRRDERLEYMSVSSEEGLIVVSLPTDMYDKYALYRQKNINVTSCAFLFPAMVETVSLLSEGRGDLEQWPDEFSGARLIVVQSLAKLGLSPREVAQKGSVFAASAIFANFKENHGRLFSELSTSYESE